MADLPTIHSLWIGSHLGRIGAACLASFVANGHRVILHAYERPEDLPDGVELMDANATIPRHQVIRHRKTGSYALFSDIFRYRLLRNGADVYADCDMFCLKPIERADYIFGFETDTQINGAILALPPDSPLLQTLADISEDPGFIPPWLKPRKRFTRRLAMKLRLHRGISAMGWGTIGPKAITHYAKALGVEHLAQPMDVFYPVDSRRVTALFDPDLTVADITTGRTRCVHLYNEMIRRHGLDQIPVSSPLGRLLTLHSGRNACRAS
jgi:hypothetical protein